MPILLSESKPKARKVHRCGMCNGQIVPGEVYNSATYKDDDLYVFKTCQPCEKDGIVTEVYSWCGGPSEGVMAEDAWEWAHEEASPEAERWLARHGCRCERCQEATDA